MVLICSETDREHERSGDSFSGGFAIQSQHSRETSGRADPGGSEGICPFGVAVASLCVGEKGAIPAMPSLYRWNAE